MTDPFSALESLRGRLIVSCQASADSPLRASTHMVAMARAALAGGAAGIRAEGLEDIAAIRAAIGNVPLIGLWKDGDPSGVFITPTVRHAAAVASLGPQIVAVDGTDRPRPDGSTFAEIVAVVHAAGSLVMADVASADEGVAAARQGADLIATTLSGYTEYSQRGEGHDLNLIDALIDSLDVPIIAEGRIWTPDEARAAIDHGAFAVVVGSAITRPEMITARFVASLPAVLPAITESPHPCSSKLPR